ncbi:MAG: Sensory box histidine kinase [Candidatus Jettenia ecosi]|uniref:histidine kinase n=1 Tax=Candidatus Jettenia ecosi TaxID=2494326 RepID=A0A533QLJ0_9BACT|nr:MAG: Sensory box histidine kinase [Candidatus Jettenia ecosi]
MAEIMRKTGIDIIGDTTWGTHLSLFYQTREDLIDILVPYFKAGLENNEFCMWITSEPLAVEEAKSAMKKTLPDFEHYIIKKQAEIISYNEWYLKDGIFNLQEVLNGLVDKLSQAKTKGYDGMRITGNTAWLEKKDWKSFADYEEAIDNVLSYYPMMAICSYSLDKCRAYEIIDVVRNHQFALIKREGKLELIQNIEKKRVREALQKSEEKYRILYETIKDGIVATDMDGHILECNEAYAGMLGYSKEEIKNTAKFPSENPYPVLRIAQDGTILYANSSGKFFLHEWNCEVGQCIPDFLYQFITRAFHTKAIKKGIEMNHGDRIFSFTIVPVKDTPYVNLYGVDITERKQMEEGLRKLSNAVEQNPCSIIITNTGGKIEYVNSKFVQLTGYTFDEVVGKNPRILKSGKTPIEVYEQLWSVITSGNVWHGEFVNKKKNGELYWESASVSPIKKADGTIAHFVAIKEDVTEQKRFENELRKQRDQLEYLTAQLTAANKELEAFCYSVSHDLRAPLRGIDGFSKALMEDYADTLDEQGKNYLHRIRTASQRMGQLINDLLNLSRITRSEMRRKEVDLSAMVKTLALELREKQPERRVEFIVADELIANGDPQLLRIAMENLLNNAWKFTKTCMHAKIEFGFTRRNGSLVYFIRDNGAGFDMAYIDKLFAAFQRLHSSSEFEGTGIGLATVQRIIQRHGGKIWAEGEVNKGATFYFTLP